MTKILQSAGVTTHQGTAVAERVLLSSLGRMAALSQDIDSGVDLYGNTTVLSPCGLPIEIQVRTHTMHSHAESGAASHLRYKQLQAKETSRG